MELHGSAAVAFIVTLAMMYDVLSATNSSPQTTHINAKARADTLMLWVHIGLVQAILFAIVAAFIAYKTGDSWQAIIIAGVIGAVALYAQYIYALKAGLREAAEGAEVTETYG